MFERLQTGDGKLVRRINVTGETFYMELFSPELQSAYDERQFFLVRHISTTKLFRIWVTINEKIKVIGKFIDNIQHLRFKIDPPLLTP